MYACVSDCLWTCLCIFVSMYQVLCVDEFVYVFVYINVRIRDLMIVCVNIYVCGYSCVFYVYVCVYACMYV